MIKTISLFAFAFVLPISSPSALSSVVVLARAGDTIEGQAALEILRAPSISGDGTVAFPARLDNGSLGIVLICVDGTRQILVDGDPVRGLDDAAWRSFSNTTPTIAGGGSVLWPVLLTGPGLPSQGLTGVIGGPLNDVRLIFQGDTYANGLPPGWRVRVRSARYSPMASTVLLGSAYAPEGDVPTSVLLLEGDPIPSVLAIATGAAPGLPSGEVVGAIGNVSMNDHGVAVFASESGIWLVEGETLVSIAVKGDPVPFLPGHTFTGGFADAAMNNHGEVVAYAEVSGNDGVIFTGLPGDLREVAQLRHLPDLPNGEAPDTLFQGPIINANGTIAFVLNSGPSDTYRPAGVYVTTGNSLTRIVAFGDPVPGYPVDWTFGEVSFNRIQMNARDQIIFQANLNPPTGFPRVPSLWGWSPGQGLFLLTAGDRSLELVTGETVGGDKVIHAFAEGTQSESSGGQDGAIRLLSDNGQAVFAIFESVQRQYIVALTLPGIGDINADGLITGADLSVLLSQFGNNVKPGDSGDFNLDGLVTGSDLSVLLSALANQN